MSDKNVGGNESLTNPKIRSLPTLKIKNLQGVPPTEVYGSSMGNLLPPFNCQFFAT